MSKRKSHDQFCMDMETKFGKKIIVVGRYLNARTPIEVKCEVGHEWENIPNALLNGRGCRGCAPNKPLTHVEFVKRVKEIDDSYEVLTDYINMFTNVWMRHKCGNVFEKRPCDFIHNHNRCTNCSNYGLCSHRDFLDKVYVLVGTEYTVIGQYKTNKEKILIRHNVCSNTWEVKPNAFLGKKGSRCPKCSDSKGNKEIEKILKKLKVDYIKEYRDERCFFKRTLPFDFAVFLNINNLRQNIPAVLIEFQGRQHFEEVEAFGGKQGLKERKRNDKLKRQFCLLHKIPLITIPYWEFENIEKVINDAISRYLLRDYILEIQ